MRISLEFWFVLLGISSTLALTAQQRSYPEKLAGRWEASDGQGGGGRDEDSDGDRNGRQLHDRPGRCSPED